jgi:hypothetical protein
MKSIQVAAREVFCVRAAVRVTGADDDVSARGQKVLASAVPAWAYTPLLIYLANSTGPRCIRRWRCNTFGLCAGFIRAWFWDTMVRHVTIHGGRSRRIKGTACRAYL